MVAHTSIKACYIKRATCVNKILQRFCVFEPTYSFMMIGKMNQPVRKSSPIDKAFCRRSLNCFQDVVACIGTTDIVLGEVDR